MLTAKTLKNIFTKTCLNYFNYKLYDKTYKNIARDKIVRLPFMISDSD